MSKFLIAIVAILAFSGCAGEGIGMHKTGAYPLHRGVSVTVFWVGEESSKDNGYIPNAQSAWDDEWEKHYGGVDDPAHRIGYRPAGFVPKENPFYFALPYNDFDQDGHRKKSAFDVVYWAKERRWRESESMCKNRWIRIVKGEKVVYAQWEDVGPFETDDADYVFGSSMPKNTINDHAGLDVSPAVRDYLGLSDVDKVDWQFVAPGDVPDGPWKEIVTTSQIDWRDSPR